MKITFDVDIRFLDEVENQAFEILFNRRLSYLHRWDLNRLPIFKKLKNLRFVICKIGLVASLFVTFTAIASLLIGKQFNIFSLNAYMVILVFFTLSILFYLMPDLAPRTENKIRNWSRQISSKSCKRAARRMIISARQLAPYRAEYSISSGSITYSREKKSVQKAVWTRNLKGVAIQNEWVTIIFKNWASIRPQIVILHKDFDMVKKALTSQNIDCKWINQSS